MCLFCKIIKGKIPTNKIYEDEKVFAFLNIQPVNPGHILVIPKKHVANLEEVESNDLKALMVVIKKMGSRLKEKLPCPAYNVIQNNGLLSGQEIMHLHFHLIPRFDGDGLKHFPHQEYGLGEAESIKERLQC